MIRYSLLFLVSTTLCLYAFRNWFISLCGLIVMMALLERSDMPSNMFGITGLNPWNVIMLFILIAFIADKARQNSVSEAPQLLRFLFVCYLIVVVVSTMRMLNDYSGYAAYYWTRGAAAPSFKNLFVDDVINAFKWLIPGFLVYKGTTGEKRAVLVVLAIAFSLLLLTLQVVKQMPVGNLVDGTSLQQRANRVLGRNVGYHRVDLAAMLAAGPWVFLALTELVRSKLAKLMLLGLSGLSLLALLLTGGRAGLVACVGVGFVLALVRWRKLIVVFPVAMIVILLAIPAAKERIFEGMSEDSYESGAASLGVDTIDAEGRDLYAITSGRIVVWPFVLAKIMDNPVVGHGRKAMLREGVTLSIIDTYGGRVSFGHPHNAYLEILLDAGFLGSLPIFWFFLFVLYRAISTIREGGRGIPIIAAIVCFSFVAAQLIASIGSQSFYPRQGTVLMWCTIGLFLATLANQGKLKQKGETG